MGLSGTQVAPLQARAGVARSAEIRANAFATVNVVTVINGVDVSAYVARAPNPTMDITLMTNDQPDTATFTLLPTLPAIPPNGSLVKIAFGQAANVQFGGQIQTRTRRYQRGIANPFVDVACIDYTRLFDRRVVNQHWSNVSATQIAADIIDLWTSGFTRASVAAGLPTIDDFSATNEAPSSLLRRLVNLFDGTFYIDGERDVHLFGIAGDLTPKAGTNPAPLTISPILPSFKPDGSDAFSFTDDLSQQRTRSIVEGESTTCPVSTPSGAVSTVVNASSAVDYLVVAAGGAGGAGPVGGGGGGGAGGGVRTGTDTITSGSYPIVVGAGGSIPGADGGFSEFNGHVSDGGGAGGGSVSGHTNGDTLGSGGGGNGAGTGGGTLDPAEGNSGGNGDLTLSAAGGGGGGAGGAGGNAGPNAAGAGGPGIASSLSGSPQFYAAGGGGDAIGTPQSGGSGIGGNGGHSGSSTPGAPGTGSGGGGSTDNSAALQAGGSGIVILSYPDGALSATGGVITHVGGRTIHTFTANDTFVVSTITLTASAPLVTDIPLADASQINPMPGFVRIGTQVFPYLTTAGPVVASGTNPPGSSLSSDASPTDTTLHINDATPFTASPGWVKVGDQYVRYTGVGSGTLTGIPAVGFGALGAVVKSGTSVTWIGALVLSVTGVMFDPPLAVGDTVTQRVIVDDVSAQTALAAIEGGDGVHEVVVSDGRLSIAGATNRANAEVADFGQSIDSADGWLTTDMNARAGRMQAFAVGDIAESLIITRVDITFPVPNGLPWRQCAAASVHTAALLDAVVTSPN